MVARPTELKLAPIFLNDVDLWAVTKDGSNADVASKNFKQALTGVVLTPTAATTQLQTLSPAGSFSSVGTPSWACAMTYAQDWETVDSLSNYLFDTDGKAATLYFTPRSGFGLTWKVLTPRLLPGAVGGTGVNAALTATVNLGVTGKPEKLTQQQLTALFPAS